MNTEIIITPDTQVYCNLSCEDSGILREIAEYFTFMVPNARFVPSYRNKVWDGKIRLFNAYTGKFYIGLMTHLFKFCKERAYNLRFSGFSLRPKHNYTEREISRYLTDLQLASRGTLLTVQSHQKQAILEALNRSRILLLSPTGSGKSLIIYSILRKLIESQNSKILLIVPTIGLVNQMFSDFEDYSSVNGWNVEDYTQKLYYGHEKTLNKNVMIATWQSAAKLSNEFFAQFDTVVCDECFAGDTEIAIPGGFKKIKDLLPGDKVLNLDASSHVKIDEIINIHRNLINSFSEKMYKLEFDNGSSVEVTGNHKLLTSNRGWVRADELTEQDDIICVEKEIT